MTALAGDATAGDGTYSYLATVGDVESGDKIITATIADAEGRDGTASITLTVEGTITEIWQIQGTSHLSSYDGEQVFGVEGVVTATRNSTSAGGFWMTDPTPDADRATSDGIFVFKSGNADGRPSVTSSRSTARSTSSDPAARAGSRTSPPPRSCHRP